MSKEAALRAMREARYAERTANPTPARRPARPAVAPAETGTGATKATRSAKATKPAKGAGADASAAPDSEGLCGHRSMNGRTCTREQGHAAKSHRYG